MPATQAVADSDDLQIIHYITTLVKSFINSQLQ